MKASLALLLLAAVAVSAQLRVDFNVAGNAPNHHSEKYRNPSGAPQTVALIARLYQAFTIYAKSGSFAPDWTFYLSDSLSTAQKTQIQLTVKKNDGKSVTLVPATKFIGRYKLLIKDGSGKTVFLSNTDVFLLFNPWSDQDDTYALGQNAAGAGGNKKYAVNLTEHVLNEFGAVWQGSSRGGSATPWAYNHLDLKFLNTTMGLLAPLSTNQRDAWRVARFLTVAEQSVLAGRWDGQYSDGAAPGTWTSSSDIVNKYVDQGYSIVKYGQCWVFSSLYTALARTLGLPCNSVTNLGSAHEHRRPFKQVCDMKWVASSTGMSLGPGSTCSIWNFHVWNDVWINKRGDGGTAGWQAVDATPQETSKQGPKEVPFSTEDYWTGPAALADLKAKNYVNFDGGFVGGETESLVINYNCVGGKCTETDRSTTAVGMHMIVFDWTNSVRSVNGGYTQPGWVNWAPMYTSRTIPTNTISGTGIVATSFVETDEVAYHPSSSSHSSASHASHASASTGKPAPESSGVVRKNNDFKTVVPKLVLGKPTVASLAFADGHKPSGTWGLHIQIVPIDYRTGLNLTLPLKIARAVVTATSKQNSVDLTIPAKFWTRADVLAALERTNYFQVIYSASSPSGGPPFFKKADLEVVRPKLAVLCGHKPDPHKHTEEFAQGDKIYCNVKFYHVLDVKLTNLRPRLTITGQSSRQEKKQLKEQQEKIKEQHFAANATDVDENGESLKGTHTIVFGSFEYTLMGAPGKQVVVATLNSKQIRNLRGSNTITIKPNEKAVSQQSQQDSMESKSMGQNPKEDAGQVHVTGSSHGSSHTQSKHHF